MKLTIAVLLLLVLLVPAMAWVHGFSNCAGGSFLIGNSCSEVLTTGSVQLTAN